MNKMDKKANKPAIRFAGFTDAWEQSKLGKIAEQTYGGGTPSTANESYWRGRIPWIQSSDLSEDKFFDIIPKKHLSGTAIHSSTAKIVPRNSIAIITRVGVGKLAFMPFSYATSQDFLSLSKLKIDAIFAVYSIYRKLQKELSMVQGTSIKGITKEEVLAKYIMVPCGKDEQSKIGIFSYTLDTLITLHQRKYDKLVNLKKSMLEKMFPQHGADVPEIRFSGFKDSWKRSQVGELIEDYVEKTTTQNQFPVLTSSQQQGIVLQEDYFADRQVTTNDNIGYFVLPKGYFTYRSRSDTDIFVFNRNNLIEKGIISYYYPVFSPKNTDSNFLLRRLNHGIKSQLSMSAEGTGQRVLAHSKFKKMIVNVPRIDEQIQMGQLFETLDHLITLHQRKLEKLQNIKKSCLEKMFV